MPISKSQVFGIVQRLSKGLPLDALRGRLAPTPIEKRPSPPDVPAPKDWTSQGRDLRVAFVESRGTEIPNLAGRGPQVDPAAFKGNIEQFIGMTQIPTGLIGPLRVNGLHAHGDYYVPLATSEGSLVASYNRGARLVTRAGGVTAITTMEQVQRTPGFVFESIIEATQFAAWATAQFDRFAEIAAARSSHAQLLDVHTHLEANWVYLLFQYHTGDAAGQNMVTFCTEAICQEILATAPHPPRHWFLESNMSGDKKATVLSFQQTRGRNVMAETVLSREIVEQGLHTTPERMCDYWRMSFVGATRAGATGMSGHIANGIAAIFLACGQDVACVSEASVGMTRMELTPEGHFYCCVTLPNLIVGTVGGGTRLPTAQECLRIMHCEGTGMAQRFAEICAATVLAGEISIAGAMSAGHFARAHQELGRGGAA
jgi:hydroxymethylglutaryl-CoA reductase (NADPH)